MRRGHLRRWSVCAALAAALAVAVLLPAAAGAQCAMCKTGVQAGGEQTQKTFQRAMLVLLVPPVAIFCGLFAVAYRGRRAAAGSAGVEGEGEDG